MAPIRSRNDGTIGIFAVGQLKLISLSGAGKCFLLLVWAATDQKVDIRVHSAWFGTAC